MRTKLALYLLTVLSCSSLAVGQAEDPVKKLGAFLGTWQTAGSFAGSDNKISSTLECRWSPQGIFLVCDQLVNLREDLINRPILSFRLPGRVRGITIPAPQIAPAGAHKHARRSGQKPLPLQRSKYLSNSHGGKEAANERK